MPASLKGSRGAKRTKTLKNPDLHTPKVSINGASGGKEGKPSPSEPPNTGQRSGRFPVGSSSPKPVADESGRFDKKQRKRARRRKAGKNNGTEAATSGAQGSRLDAERGVAGSDKPAPARISRNDNHSDSVKSGQKSGKKLSNRRRRSRRKKQQQENNAPAQAVQVAAPAQATAQTHAAKHPAQHHITGHASGRHGHKAVHAKPETADHSKHRPQHNQPNGAQTAQPRAYEPPLYAALDLGTNNCRLLIATPSRPGQFRVVDSFSRIVRLGEGFGTTGRLSDQAMSRAIEALKICRDKLESKNIRRRRLIATEACRSASNGAEFLQRVREEAGLELEIVDRQTEASLAVSGCGTLVNRETDALVLFDIGGGSSEIALIDVTCRRSSRLAEHITAWTSLPVGVVTLAEKFGGRDVTPENYAEMVTYVANLLNDFSERHKLGELAQSTHFHLLGTSGTVTTLAGIHLGLERYDRRRVDGMWMGAQDVTDMTEKLLSWDFKTRVANPCIGADRADLVLAGCAILDAIRQIWPSERLLVADRGLREGILTELMSRDGAWRHRRPHQAKETYMKNGSGRDTQTKGRQSI
ncbi:MAG: Ppx/GppA family phosphatase [Brucellaceae bacterium]|jgi:exopolyphosphatase/guanosine-5'-triphosphate,3'-diphosphate pyrophosphatase|nr:Ppx/GppA family phosphatase [Brucellaceae bacterium]